MAITIEDLVKSPQFLKDYSGKKILTVNKQGSAEGGTLYDIGSGGVSSKPFDVNIPNQDSGIFANFNVDTGALTPRNIPGGSIQTSELYKYLQGILTNKPR